MTFSIVRTGLGSDRNTKYYIKYGHFVIAEFYFPNDYCEVFELFLKEKGISVAERGEKHNYDNPA